jgi:hypothetical protein
MALPQSRMSADQVAANIVDNAIRKKNGRTKGLQNGAIQIPRFLKLMDQPIAKIK